jgi:hypothetical protein
VSSSPGPLDGLMSPRGTNSFVDGLLGAAKGSGGAAHGRRLGCAHASTMLGVLRMQLTVTG